MNLIAQLEAEQIAALGKTIPDFKAGDTIRVGYKVTEGTFVYVAIDDNGRTRSIRSQR